MFLSSIYSELSYGSFLSSRVKTGVADLEIHFSLTSLLAASLIPYIILSSLTTRLVIN